MPHRSHTSGFVLLLVLAVIAVAGTALAAAARLCFQNALDAAIATEDLQVRWGVRSCRQALSLTERVLAMESDARNRPMATARRRVTLGAVNMLMVFGDEQAKANVNLLAVTRDKDRLESCLGELQAGVREFLPIRLAPEAPPADLVILIPVQYSSFDQVFAPHRPSSLMSMAYDTETVADRLTCWGSGRLNFKRAEPDAIRQVTDGLLNDYQVAGLLRFRSDTPDASLAEALIHLDLSDTLAGKVRIVMTDASACHSLWVVAESDSRQWHHLFIQDERASLVVGGQWSFAW